MDIVTVKMTETINGSPNGVFVREYENGQTYDIPSDLAEAFIKHMKVAKKVARPQQKEE